MTYVIYYTFRGRTILLSRKYSENPSILHYFVHSPPQIFGIEFEVTHQ